MRLAFCIVSGVIGQFIGYGYPLIAALRGKRFLKTILKAWLLLFTYMLCLCVILPGVVTLFDREFGRQMFRSWVPEGPAVAAALIAGWLPPVMAGLVGLAFRWLFQAYWPRALARIENWRFKHEEHA
jgi:hypothetical protein